MSLTKVKGSVSPEILETQGITLANLTISSFLSTGFADGSWIHFAGRDTVGDGGGGKFRYSASSTQAADGGTVFAPTGGGRIFRNGWTIFGFNGDMNPRWFGAKGDSINDDTSSFQACINAAMKQYDPTQTTHNGNDVTYMGRQVKVNVTNGRYKITQTLNFSFRNYITFEGEDQWNTIIFWDGAVDGMIIDARCSNYADWKNFTLDGNHKALTFIYQAGNGNNAVGSKGNVTGNRFSKIYFWNQKGNLVPPFVDYSDQYNPLTAMLCTTSIDTPLTYYNSMDDSFIENCRFAANSLNNFYCMAISSSGISISDTQLFAGNGILASNGAQFWMRGCVASLYAPSVQDSQHNHALIKFDYNGGLGSVFRDIELHDCYLEGMDYYGNGHSVKMAYWAQGSGAVAEQDKGVLNLLVNGGLYSGTAQNQNYTYIDIQANRRANIRLINSHLQGPAKLYVYAPDSAVEVSDASLAISGNSLDTQTWQITVAKSISRKYQTPELQVQGSVAPTISAVVGTSDYPGQIRFLSLDEALEYLSDCKSPVVIYLEQDDTVTRGGTLNGDVTIALQGFTLNINATLTNRGNLTIRNSFANNTRGGTLASTGNYLRNTGSVYVQDCYLNKAINNASGACLAVNVEFTGTSDSVLNTGAGRVVVDLNTCAFSGSGFVVNLGEKFGDVMVKSTYGAIPSSGKWMRGTRLEHDPSTPYPNQYWATVDEVGVAANWAKVGNLAL